MRRMLGRLVVSALMVGLSFAGLALPAAGSQAEIDVLGPAATIRQTRTLPTPHNGSGTVTSPNFWVWPEENSGYFLSGPTGNVKSSFSRLTRVDLATGQEIQTRTLDFAASASQSYYSAMPHNVAIDREQGRLLIAEGGPGPSVPDIVSARVADKALQYCRGVNTSGSACATGIQVLDAESLASIRRIPFADIDRPRADGLLVGRRLYDMRYSRRGTDNSAKVLVLSSEFLTAAVGSTGSGNPRQSLNADVVYAEQYDIESGQLDWIVRVDACRGDRTPGDAGDRNQMEYRPAPGVIYRLRSEDRPAVIVGCFSGGGAVVGTAVRIPLDAEGRPAGLPVTTGNPAALATEAADDVPVAESRHRPAPAEQPLSFFGPDKTAEIWFDEISERMLFNVVDGSPAAMVWWVFDTSGWRLLGTIGIGAVSRTLIGTASGLDVQTGRLYVLNTPTNGQSGGLFVADVGRTPLPQALVFPEFAHLAKADSLGHYVSIAVARKAPDQPASVFLPSVARVRTDSEVNHSLDGLPPLPVLLDALPLATGEPAAEERRTFDIDEQEGVTAAALDGAARGYGARALFVGGIEGVTRAGPMDVLGTLTAPRDQGAVKGYWATAGSPRVPCAPTSRDVVLAFVGPRGPAVVDGSGSRGGAEPVVIDSSTRTDIESPYSRCAGAHDAIEGWDEVWTTALFGRPPTDEPNGVWPFESVSVECVSSDESPASSVGDPVANAYAAAVNCADDEASGHAYARGSLPGDVQLGEALSSYRIYKDPGRGVVSRVESVARAIRAGPITIDTVRGVAESWANGRAFTPPIVEDGGTYRANCDYQRTAGTCFQRHVFGVRTPAYSCGPCGDEATMMERMSRAMGAYGSVRLREPDPGLAEGTLDGFTAGIAKPDDQRFADLVLNNDLLQTVLPTLEIVRQAPPNRPLVGGGVRGRQIYQFAGVEVSSSYSIQCLLVYDEATNTCAAPAEEPGSIQVSLSDTDGKPLAGGAFEVRQDVDADGVLGLKDTLLPDGACLTADDGVGTCLFENLQPGTYLVSQVAAPPGYAKSAEPWVSEVASGEQRTVAFTNVFNVSTIDLTATDENGAPLAGAVFAAYPDADSDGKVAPDAQPAAECTTDAQGACQMKVPAGSYVLVQTSAPGGLEGIEPVPFTFASGGQVASVSVVNYPPASPAQPEGAASPVYTPPVDQSPPREFIDPYVAPEVDVIAPDVAPGPSVPDRIGGTVTQVIRAPGDALRLLARDPKQAVAWTATLALFVLAAMAIRRRQHAMALMAN